MKKYTKIQTVFKRCKESGPDKNKLIDGDWTLPEFELLKDAKWEATEKIDGTNINISWDADEGRVRFAGRDEDAQIPARLVNVLVETFPASKFADMGSMIIFGEGYGIGIQKVGKKYLPDSSGFTPFDVWCGGLWLERKNIEDISEVIGLNPVPSLGKCTLEEAIKSVSLGFPSRIGTAPAEGLVLRAPCGLLTRRGERLITKIKTKDFTKGTVPMAVQP